MAVINFIVFCGFRKYKEENSRIQNIQVGPRTSLGKQGELKLCEPTLIRGHQALKAMILWPTLAKLQTFRGLAEVDL